MGLPRKGEVQPVEGVTFSAREGEITGLVGPKGAGKTTTLRMLYTLMKPDSGQVLVDGNRCPRMDDLGFECLNEAVVKGDAKVPSISAASILAKTTRDALMCELDGRYPGFSLSGHKGYGTPSHVAALHSLGPSPLHRRSFAPVRAGQAGDYLAEDFF